METIFADKTLELKRTKSDLERKLNVKITIEGKKVTIDGSPADEFDAKEVIEAIGFGFSTAKALQIKSGEFMFRKLSIKKFTRRKDLREVKARLIGTEGKTKRTIENLSKCDLVISGNSIGIICSAELMETELTAIENLIRGSKQANVYRYLEKMNAIRKEQEKEELLGLNLKPETKQESKNSKK
jgi:ribosomal RNA assembly protein